MNRKEFMAIARVRLREARVLLENKCYDGAYYLSGYAVECGLKAAIAKLTKRHDFPDKRTIQEFYTHDLSKLVGLAGLKGDLDATINADGQFKLNWAQVKDWSEESRYRRYAELQARDLYKAVADRGHGVMRWIRRHW